MYLGYQNGQIKFYTEQPLDKELYNIDEVIETQDEYVLDGECYVLKDEAWEEKQKAKEKERIQELFMTRSDFFDGIIKAFDIGSEELLNIIQNVLKSLPISTTEIKIAINNYKNALNFYRKHPLFKMLSDIEIKFSEKITAKFTEEQWDRFFIETNKKSPDAYKALLPNN